MASRIFVVCSSVIPSSLLQTGILLFVEDPGDLLFRFGSLLGSLFHGLGPLFFAHVTEVRATAGARTTSFRNGFLELRFLLVGEAQFLLNHLLPQQHAGTHHHAAHATATTALATARLAKGDHRQHQHGGKCRHKNQATIHNAFPQNKGLHSRTVQR